MVVGSIIRRYSIPLAFWVMLGTAFGMIMVAAITPITIEIPDWFYKFFTVAFSVFTLAFIYFVFQTGMKWSKIKEICAEFPKIRRALDVISELLLVKGWTKESLYVSSGSPLQLTPAGRKMLTDSGFEEFYGSNKERLFSYMASKNPESPAEVETTAKEAMFYLEPKVTPKMELIENYAYNNGKPVADILFAYSIELRDRYLLAHPELK